MRGIGWSCGAVVGAFGRSHFDETLAVQCSRTKTKRLILFQMHFKQNEDENKLNPSVDLFILLTSP